MIKIQEYEDNKLINLIHNNLLLDLFFKSDIKFWIAGGFIREYYNNPKDKDYKYNDIDLFFENEDDHNNLIKYVYSNVRSFSEYTNKNKKLTYEILKNNDRSLLLKIDYDNNNNLSLRVDFIKIYNSNPIELLERFDFSVNMFCYDYQNNKLYKDINSIDDIKNKALRINPDRLDSIIINHRIERFYLKGYINKIENNNIVKIDISTLWDNFIRNNYSNYNVYINKYTNKIDTSSMEEIYYDNKDVTLYNFEKYYKYKNSYIYKYGLKTELNNKIIVPYIYDKCEISKNIVSFYTKGERNELGEYNYILNKKVILTHYYKL